MDGYSPFLSDWGHGTKISRQLMCHYNLISFCVAATMITVSIRHETRAYYIRQVNRVKPADSY